MTKQDERIAALEDRVTKLEGLVPGAGAESRPDPDVIPADDPSFTDTAQPAPASIGATATSPFVDEEEEEDESSDGGDTDDQVPAQSSEATSVPPTTAESVTEPEAEVTPSTENPPTEQA